MAHMIAYLPMDWSGCGHYRLHAPMRAIRQFGVKSTCFEPLETRKIDEFTLYIFDLTEPPDGDLYVLQRRAEAEALVMMQELKAQGKKIIVETDDHYGVLPINNPAWTTTHPSWKVRVRKAVEDGEITLDRDGRVAPEHQARAQQIANATARQNRDWFHKGCQLADAITVSTPELARYYAGRFGKPTYILPNRLDWPMWADVEPAYDRPPINGRVRIGYMAAPAFHAEDAMILRGLLGPFLDRHPEVDFVASGKGAGAFHDIIGVPEGQRITLEWQHFEDVPKGLHFDIGIVPLADNAFNEAKSALKGMEYNARGIPYVATPTEPYRDYTVEGHNGFLAKKPRQWARRLEELLDPEVRLPMGIHGRTYAYRHAIQHGANATLWKDAYEEVLNA